nr:YHYH domain-containing protein [Bathymodiolus japonicus methanotrophic gill symbiont]
MLSKRLLYTLLLTLPVSSYSHTGGLNKEGCHTNKKTATYHCHTQKKLTKRSEPNKPTQSALSKGELPSPALIDQADDHSQDFRRAMLPHEIPGLLSP